jgi:uncharacterized alkaline shock family protein YloU
MSEQQELRSPLQSDRGATTIKDGVVSKIAGMAAREVRGVYLGGSTSRAAGGLLGNVTGSSGGSRGVSVEVGRVETAIDLKMGIEYGRNILQTVEEVRRRISDRVTQMTGLRITELNVTISDIVFPGDEDGDGEAESGSGYEGYEQPSRPARTADLRTGVGDREVGRVEPRSRTHTEAYSGPVPDEEVRVERRPLREDETAELRVGEGEVEKRRKAEDDETPRARRRDRRGEE